MKHFLKKIKSCDKFKLIFRCPECEKNVVLDEEVFIDDPKQIICYGCRTTFKVSVIKNHTTHMDIGVTKE